MHACTYIYTYIYIYTMCYDRYVCKQKLHRHHHARIHLQCFFMHLRYTLASPASPEAQRPIRPIIMLKLYVTSIKFRYKTY